MYSIYFFRLNIISFNLFVKESDYFIDISTYEEYSTENLKIDIDNIPTLKVENIKNIVW